MTFDKIALMAEYTHAQLEKAKAAAEAHTPSVVDGKIFLSASLPSLGGQKALHYFVRNTKSFQDAMDEAEAMNSVQRVQGDFPQHWIVGRAVNLSCPTRQVETDGERVFEVQTIDGQYGLYRFDAQIMMQEADRQFDACARRG